MSPGANPGSANGNCPRCGVAFRCGMVGNDAQCWCAGLPSLPVLPVPAAESGASCYCPDCLRALKAELAARTQAN